MGAMKRDPAQDTADAYYRDARTQRLAGNDAAALVAYEAALELDPWHVGSLAEAGALALQRDAQELATRCYRELFNLTDDEILEAPELPEVARDSLWGLIGLAEKIERQGLALAILDILAAGDPDDGDVPLAQGEIYLAMKRPREAVIAFSRATVLRPDLAPAWSGLGTANRDAGSLVRARQALERAVSLDPGAWQVRLDLVSLLMEQKLTAAASPHLRDLAERVADDVRILGQVGLELLHLADHSTALVAFDKMRRADADNCLAGLGAGAALIGLERKSEAVPLLEQALKRLPRDVDLILSLTRLFEKLLPRTVLSAMLGACVDLTWSEPDRLRGVVGEAYRERYGDLAVRGLERLHALAPDDGSILPALIDAKLSACDWGGGDALAKEVLDAAEARMNEGRKLDIDVWNLFAIGVDYPTLARAARYKSAQIEREVAPLRARCDFRVRPPRGDRLRIGYLCPYTIRTSHIDNLLTVVRHHDRSRVALYGYSISPETGDCYEDTFKECFDGFRHTPLDTLEESARAIYDDALDILIDTTGHFSASCMKLAALRPAPVVMHGTAGFNIIGGASFYDYSLNDSQFLTGDLVDLYIEKPFYMPHSAMPAELLEISDAPISRAEFGIPEDAFVFADFNHPCKFDPTGFAAWMEILRRVPDSVLVLGDWVSDTEDRLRGLAETQGVDPARIIFSPFQVRARHLQRLQLCDLALDTFYHCGGVTTVDCLIAGLPILTALPDRSLPLANRSLLVAMDLDDMVMPDLDSYVERAVALANAPDDLAAVRARMQVAHHSAPLFQAERWVRNLERSCEIIHRRRLDGDEPAPFTVLDIEDWPDRHG